MSDPTVKTFTVSGEAAASIGGTRKRRKRTTARTETVKMDYEEPIQTGGTSPGTLVQLQASKTGGESNFQKSTDTALAKITTDSSPAPLQGGAKVPLQGGGKAPVQGGGKTPVQEAAKVSVQQGGKAVKVILEKKKKSTRVLLAPTKVKKLQPTVVSTPGKTRKVAKKIRMSLNGFGKRVTRANTIRVEAKKQSIDEVKKILVEAKLIKADSKAPESVLRTMYADYMMLKNRAL
jgi:hypothetical protein